MNNDLVLGKSFIRCESVLRTYTLSFPDFKTRKATKRRQRIPRRQRTQINAINPTVTPTINATEVSESEESFVVTETSELLII